MPNLMVDSNDSNVAATVYGSPWSPSSPHREKLIQLQSELEELMRPGTPQFVLDRLRILHADISRELGEEKNGPAVNPAMTPISPASSDC